MPLGLFLGLLLALPQFRLCIFLAGKETRSEGGQAVETLRQPTERARDAASRENPQPNQPTREEAVTPPPPNDNT